MSGINSARKTLRVFKALKGHTLNGVSNQTLAHQLGMPASGVSRAMDSLIAEGLAQRLESGNYALSVMTLQIAQAHANEVARATERITEINQRVLAGA